MTREKMAKSKSRKETTAAAPKAPPVKIERFTQSLMVALKPAEIAERADRAAHLIADRDNLREEAKQANKERKTKIDGIGSEIRRLSSEVREKCCYREVPCERRFLYTEKLVRDVRSDTGDVLMERPMTEEESQRSLDFPDGGGGAAGDVDDEFSEGS